MKRFMLFMITMITLLASVAHAISSREYSQLFHDYNACFILYDVNKDKIVTKYNPHNYCNERVAPDSTFKIAISLMAFDQGIINQQTVFKWDGIKRELPGWNHDQTPQSWLQNSTLWVSQRITPQLGYARIKRYLAGFKYGNQDFSGDPGKNNGLTFAWLSSSLKISAKEQLEFLKAMLNNRLPVSAQAAANTKANLYLGKLDGGADYYGKTGSGRHGHNEREANPSQLRDGWFVGFIENGNERYIFVSNLSDKIPAIDKSYGSMILKPITVQLLNEYFSTKQ